MDRQHAVDLIGLWVVLDGTWHGVEAHGTDHVVVDLGRGPERLYDGQFDELVDVSGEARWRGGWLSLERSTPEGVQIRTQDRALAVREELAGEFWEGWYAVLPLDELDEVVLTVTRSRRRSGGPVLQERWSVPDGGPGRTPGC